MTEKVLIVSKEENKIFATLFQKEECENCNANCNRKNKVFEVENPRAIDVEEGDVVLISANPKIQALQGTVSLLFPFLCAILGYFISPTIMTALGRPVSEDVKAVFVLLFLFVAAFFVFFLTRRFPIPGKPEIIEVL